jgi:two-component system chemotaxis sensor kinase CheA
MVDKINDTQEIVVKPLGKQLKIKTFAGASIMGDGKVALILDVMGLAQRANVITEARDREGVELLADAASLAAQKRSYLLFAGPDDAHMAVPLDTLARLEEFPESQVEVSGTRLVTQYRGEILPLVKLSDVLEERRQRPRHSQATEDRTASAQLQVLVCNHNGQHVGLVVDRIVDIVDDATEVRYPSSRTGVLWSAVIQGKVTELIDIPVILQSARLETLQLQDNRVEVLR